MTEYLIILAIILAALRLPQWISYSIFGLGMISLYVKLIQFKKFRISYVLIPLLLIAPLLIQIPRRSQTPTLMQLCITTGTILAVSAGVAIVQWVRTRGTRPTKR